MVHSPTKVSVSTALAGRGQQLGYVTLAAFAFLTLASCSRSKDDAETGSSTLADTLLPANPAPVAPLPFPESIPRTGDTASSQQWIAQGDSIFNGLTGGICYTCHGMKGVGTQLAPNLADAQWLHGDGGRPFLVRIITSGVPAPQQYPSMMPPFGGTPLTPEQVQGVAAYVYSPSHLPKG